MTRQLVALVIAPTLLGSTADTPDRLDAGQAVVVEARYGSPGVGRRRLSLAARHATGRFSIAASLGARQRLRLEAACSHSWRPTSYGAQDGCELSAGWRF